MKFLKSVSVRFFVVALLILWLPGCASVDLDTKKAEFLAEGITPFWLIVKYKNVSALGGVSIELIYRNLSDKTIKYIDFEVTPYNAVGDVISGDFDGKTTVLLNKVGPIGPGERRDTTWENIWYNSTFRCFELNSVEITYMDGSTGTLSKEEIDRTWLNAMDEKISNTCKP